MTIDYTILTKYIDNSLSDEEKIQVETWMADSPDNKKIVEQMYFTLQLTDRIRVMNSVDVNKAFDHFKKKTNRQKRKISLGSTWLGFQRVAAILFIPLLVLSGLLYTSKSNIGLQMVEVNTNPGIVSTFDLPDGSKVWLNAGSSLKYTSSPDADKREVYLDGEGYFEVIKDNKRPFIVQVNPNYSVEVLGTSFNINAYTDEEAIETTLVEGSVKLNILSENGNYISRHLKPNEKAEYKKHEKSIDIETIQTEFDTGWKNGEIIFRQHPMSRVLKVLSRHYNVEFEVKDQDVLNAVITARFKDEQLPQVMEYLSVASGIKYKINKPLINDNNIMQMSKIEISK